MPRRSPRGGYDFSRKRDYRRKVWATFRDGLKRLHLSVSESQALLMPSLEGDEIEVALNAGFRECHLHVVDKEPAIVATLKRRYPKIQTYGVTASRALVRMQRSGVRLSCANFDFCNQMSEAWAHEILQIGLLGAYKGSITGAVSVSGQRGFGFQAEDAPGSFDEQALIAVSMLRGRESAGLLSRTALSDGSLEQVIARLSTKTGYSTERLMTVHPMLAILRSFSSADRYRIMKVCSALSLDTHCPPGLQPPSCGLRRSEFYLSTSGQTMLWSIWEVTSFRHNYSLHLRANLRRRELGIPELRMDRYV